MMGLFSLRYLTLLSWVTVAAGDDLKKMLSYTWTVEGWDWEWVLIKITGVYGSLGEADYFSAADAQLVVSAVNAIEPPIEIDSPLSRFESVVEEGTNNPEWFEIGMVTFQKNTVSHLDVVLKDVDYGMGDDDILMESRVVLPTILDEWVDVSPSNGDFILKLELKRSRTPLFTEQQQEDMDLTEVLFDLDDGSKASLVHHKTAGNKKAVLYFPGRNDAFAHPNVLQMYKEKGYDFYSIDPRACGRARRFMDEADIRLAHSIDNFDKYKEEIELSLDFIRQQANYTQLLAHCHSTGALVGLNYAMLVDGEPFDGYVLNGPFLDWAYVGGDVNEFALENAGKLEWFGVSTLSTANALSAYHSKNWIINRYNTTLRPIYTGHVTTEWAQAATDVQNKIIGTPKSDPITSTPVLLICSLGDTVLLTSETEARIHHVAANYTKVILEYNSHDVTYSRTQKLNDDAIANISDWLDDPTPTHFSSSKRSMTIGMMGQIFSSMMFGLFSLL